MLLAGGRCHGLVELECLVWSSGTVWVSGVKSLALWTMGMSPHFLETSEIGSILAVFNEYCELCRVMRGNDC